MEGTWSLAQSFPKNKTLSSSNGLAKKDEICEDFELKRPRKVKDFTMLENLAKLALHCIPKCDSEWHHYLLVSVLRNPNVKTNQREIFGSFSLVFIEEEFVLSVLCFLTSSWSWRKQAECLAITLKMTGSNEAKRFSERMSRMTCSALVSMQWMGKTSQRGEKSSTTFSVTWKRSLFNAASFRTICWGPCL